MIRDLSARKKPLEMTGDPRVLLQAMPIAAYACDALGEIRYYNEAAARLWGRPPRSGEPDHRWHGPVRLLTADGRALRGDDSCMAQAVRTGLVQHDREMEVERSAGERILVRASATPLFAGSGDVTGAMIVICDVTGIRADASALRQSEARLRALMDAMPDLIWLKDERGVYLSCNPRFERFFGAAEAEIVGRTDRDFVDAELADFFRMHDRAAMAKDRPNINEEALTFASDGHTEIVETIKVPVKEPDGRLIGVLGIARDITERKRTQERLRNLAQAITQMASAVIITDADGTIEYVNPAFTACTGYAPDEVVGRNPRILKSGTTPPEVYREMWRMLRAGQVWRGELHNRRKDGSPFWEHATIAPVRDGEGNTTHYVAVKEDITERKAVEQELRMTQFSLDHCPDSVLWFRPDGRIIYANSTCCERLGHTRAAMLGMSIWDIDPDISREDWPGYWKRIVREQTVTFQLHHRTKGGRVFPVEITANALAYDGHTYGCSIVRDLTERKRIEEAERDRKQLRAALKSMEQVIGVIGHELRTPLAALRATSELLLSDYGTSPDEARQYLENILGETVRMADMVNNMLEAARLNSGSARWNWTRVDLAAAVNDALSIIRPLIDADHVVLEAEGTAGLTMRGDPDAIRRLMINLTSNAAKHTREGTVRIVAGRYAEGDGPWIRIRVSDTGEGIPESIFKKLGQAFVLNSGVVGSDYVKGTGLGLAVCKGIVAAHGGRLTVHSEVGAGTTFTAELRADLPAPAACDGPCAIEEALA